MIFIAGISALQCTKSLRRLIKKSCYKSIIKNILKTDNIHTIYEQTGKHLSCLNTGMPSYLPVNTVYWPNGANRFGIGAFLVTEEAASIIISTSLSKSPTTIAYDKLCATNNEYFTEDGLYNKKMPLLTSGDTNPLIKTIMKRDDSNITDDDITWVSVRAQHDGKTHWNTMPLPVLITQRSWFANPLRYQAFFWALMIPIAYIPLIDSDNIVSRNEFRARYYEGCGILIMVDQRYLWKFTYIPNLLLIRPESNRQYEKWYDILNIIKKYLGPWQYEDIFLSRYNRKFFHEYINEKEKPDAANTPFPTYDDDRALLGPPVNLASEGRDLTLAELMALVEQSLGKKLILHPNWQVEFIDPISARKRLLKNTLLYAPRVLYSPDDSSYNSSVGDTNISNSELYKEAGINRPPDPTKEQLIEGMKNIGPDEIFCGREFPITSGGLIANTAKRGLWVDEGEFGGQPVRTVYAWHELAYVFPEPRYAITLPHTLQVVGSFWRIPVETVEFIDSHFRWPADTAPTSPWMFPARIYQFTFFRMATNMPFDTVELLSRVFPFHYTYYTAYLVERDIATNKDMKQIVVDDYNKFTTKNLLLDRYDTLDDLKYKISMNGVEYKIYADIHLPGTKLGMYRFAPFDFSTIKILTTNACIIKEGKAGSFITDPLTGGAIKKYAFNNRKQSFMTGRAVARNFLAWCAFPFHWTFNECNYWPLTGFEDYISVNERGIVRVCGHHYKMLRKDIGVRYVGLDTPTREMDFYSYDKKAMMNCCGTTDQASIILCDEAAECVSRPARPLGCYEWGDIGPFGSREEAQQGAEKHISSVLGRISCPFGEWKYAVYCITRDQSLIGSLLGGGGGKPKVEWRAMIYCCKTTFPLF